MMWHSSLILARRGVLETHESRRRTSCYTRDDWRFKRKRSLSASWRGKRWKTYLSSRIYWRSLSRWLHGAIVTCHSWARMLEKSSLVHLTRHRNRRSCTKTRSCDVRRWRDSVGSKRTSSLSSRSSLQSRSQAMHSTDLCHEAGAQQTSRSYSRTSTE